MEFLVGSNNCDMMNNNSLHYENMLQNFLYFNMHDYIFKGFLRNLVSKLSASVALLKIFL